MKNHSVIGEGSYGCIIKPELKCDSDKEIITNNKSTNNISKIFESKKTYNNELKLAKKIAKIDPSSSKMLIPSYGCLSSYDNIIKQVEYINYDCELDIYKNHNYYHLVMPYGGKDMKDYFDDNETTCKEFLTIIKPLFEGIKLLIKKKYCHQDIKFYNVLINLKKKAMIIDYGLMKPFKNIYSIQYNGSRLKYTYSPYPPEYKLFYYFHYDLTYFMEEVKKNIKKIGNDYIYDYISENQIDDKLKKMYIKYHSIAQDQTELAKILIKYANKIDIYSVGIIFVKMNKYINCKVYSDFIIKLIEFDPELRISCEEALHELDNLLTKL